MVTWPSDWSFKVANSGCQERMTRQRPNRLKNGSSCTTGAKQNQSTSAVGLFAMASSTPMTRTAEEEALRVRKEKLLNQLARLDDLYKTGTLSDRIYNLKRAELVNALAQIYYRLKFDSQTPSTKARKSKGAARA